MIESVSCLALGVGNVSSTAQDGNSCVGSLDNTGLGSDLLTFPNGPDCDRYEDSFGRSPLFGVGGREEEGAACADVRCVSGSGSVTSTMGVRDLDGGILRRH